MNPFLVILLSLISIQAFSTEEIVSRATANQPVCYGREYSADHMRSHPSQTVQKIQAKFHAEDEYNTRVMELEVTLVGEKNVYKNYRAYFINYGDNKNQWNIECDGGSTKTSMKNNKLVLENFGFILDGGCGTEGETISLKSVLGGDDIFEMTELPKEFCQNTRVKVE